VTEEENGIVNCSWRNENKSFQTEIFIVQNVLF